MLESLKIARRQSEIRQRLAELSGKERPEDAEIREMEALDGEYRQNEVRYRAALISEDDERREAGRDLETREGREWSDLCSGYEMRQAALALDEGRPLEGATAEVVQELRAAGGYRGVPIPLESLETRNTVASGTPDPRQTMPVVDRLFADSVASRMGVRTVAIGSGEREYPVVTSSVAAGWAATETGDVTGPTQFTTADRALAPDSTLGITMTVSRKAMKQSGSGLEQAIRRDMSQAIRTELDKAVFLGAGSSGEPLGIITGQSTYGYTTTAVDAAATWAVIRAAVTTFLTANAAGSASAVRLMIRPEIWDALDGTIFDTGSGLVEWDRLTKHIPAGNIVLTSNALEAPAGSPTASTAVLTTSVGGVPPAMLGLWGAVDMIRDPYSLAPSGQLKLTGLLTADVQVIRPAQVQTLTGLQD
jgi:HK97 family phage major capsid protein